jgi:inward rectifier potassium channel
MAAGYVATNLLFASLYWLAGSGAITGAEATPLGRFEDCVFFSVQTLATIGYGKLVPATRAANVLVGIEALVGLLGFAILSGLLFARFTRPTARIAFSRNAIIAPYGDGWALMFRLVNLRNHDLTDVHAVVSLARWVDEKGVRRRRFDQLALERDAIIFMPLHWVVVHPITDGSPLRGLTPESLPSSEPEVVCLISAADETFAQTVHAKTSYDKSDIVWGARFGDMYVTDADRVAIDLTRLHDIEPVPPPASL